MAQYQKITSHLGFLPPMFTENYAEVASGGNDSSCPGGGPCGNGTGPAASRAQFAWRWKIQAFLMEI